MFRWDKEWNMSFAGCGFRSIYYLGALSCILERVPQLVRGASKIGGASSGCLVAAAVTVGFPIEQFCNEVLKMAREARKHALGVFHPGFNLLQMIWVGLVEKLPEDAHLRASGKLCVSLTRMADGKNVLVSEFNSREELIQVLMCSCFFPVYCGFTPPSYRGVHYMDGGLSNNMPLFEQRNTITMAGFSGKSDICPKEDTCSFFEVQCCNLSFQFNTRNVHHVCTVILPPRPEKLAEICHNGYMDALHFLRERDLLGTQCLPPSVMVGMNTAKPPCCELVKESKKILLKGLNPLQEDHCWLDQKVIENLPAGLKKVLCEACRDSHGGAGRWSQLSEFGPVRVVFYVLSTVLVSIARIFLITKSVMQLGCAVTWRLLMYSTEFWRQPRSSGSRDPNR